MVQADFPSCIWGYKKEVVSSVKTVEQLLFVSIVWEARTTKILFLKISLRKIIKIIVDKYIAVRYIYIEAR